MGSIPLKRRLTRPALLLTGAVALTAAGVAAWPNLTRKPAGYVPGQKVDGITNELDRDTGKPGTISFTDVTATHGPTFLHFGGALRSTQLPEDMGSGAAFGDVDGDGDPDLCLVDFSAPLSGAAGPAASGTRLFRNDGGRFTDVSAEWGLLLAAPAFAALFFDSDGDGREDLLVTALDGNRFYRNAGGRFLDETARSGLSGGAGFSTGASAADFDGDGRLDVYVCRYVDYVFREEDRRRSGDQYGEMTPSTLNPSSYRASGNLLFRNLGGGRFEEVAEERGVANPDGRSLSAVWCDFDDDGRPDLYVANDVSDNAMYRNTGDGFFEDVSHAAGVADYRGAMGLAVGDFDGDLRFDLFVTHWLAQENGLYRNLATPLRFADLADAHGLGQQTLDYVGWGTAFEDFDADGDLDLAMTNGSTMQNRDDPSKLVPMPDQWFENLGAGKGFREIAPFGGRRAEPECGRGLATADVDGDGRVDVLITRNGGRAQLLRNDSGGRTVAVRLRQSGPNPHAIGSRITLRAGGGAAVREMAAGGSYLSQSFDEAVFGLGGSAEAGEISVRWPDGVTESFGAVKAGRYLLERGTGAPRPR